MGLFDLTGRVALITGASSGIGQAIAEEMAAAGAAVVVASNDSAGCERVAGALRAQGRSAIAIAADVGSRAACDALVDEALAKFGRIDVLVCNAGVQGPFGSLASTSDEDFSTVMRINLQSAVWLTNRVIPQMAERRDGSVILISSISGLRGNRMIGLYALSKAAAAQLARNLAVEWGPHNVRVNAISPGVIETPFATPITADEERAARRKAQTPLRRFGTPREIAGAAIFLASAAGAFVTGHNLVVDGGTLIGDGS